MVNRAEPILVPLMLIALFAFYASNVAVQMTWAGLAGDAPDYVVATLKFEKAFLAGYPFYVMVGWLFQKLPFTAFYNLGLLSAVSTVATSGLLYLLVRMYTGRSIWPYVAALAYSSSFIVYTQSVIPEVYTFTTMLMVAGVYATLKRSPWMIVIFGLALAAHPFMIFAWIPSLIHYYKTSEHPWRIRQLVVSICISGVIALLINLPFEFTEASTLTSNSEIGRLKLFLVSFAYVGSLAVIPIQVTLDRFNEGAVIFLVSSAAVLMLFLRSFTYVPSLPIKYLMIVSGGPAVLYLTGFPPQWITYLTPVMAFFIAAVVISASSLNSRNYGVVAIVIALSMILIIPQVYNVRQDTGMQETWDRLDLLPDGTVVIAHTWGHVAVLAHSYNRVNNDRLQVEDLLDLENEPEDFGQELKDVRRIEARNPGKEVVVATLLNPQRVSFEFVPSAIYRSSLNNTSYSLRDDVWGERVR